MGLPRVSVRFGAEMLAEWADAEEFTLEVCVEGECETLHVGDALNIRHVCRSGPHKGRDVELTVTTDAGSRTAIAQTVASVLQSGRKPMFNRRRHAPQRETRGSPARD